MYEQQTKETEHVESIYPPTASVKLPSDIPVTDKGESNIVTNIPDLPAQQRSLKHQDELVTASELNKTLAVAMTTVSAVSSIQDQDDTLSSSEGRIQGSMHLEGGQRAEVLSETEKKESLRKRRKKRGKSQSPKENNQKFTRDNVELVSPLSDDILNWLQLKAPTEKEVAQQTLESHSWSHDHHRTFESSDSQDDVKKVHQTNKALDRRLPTKEERTDLQTQAHTQHDITQATCKH